MDDWAVRAGLDADDRTRWNAAAHLHDALREIDPESLRDALPSRYRSLPGPALHGPAAAEKLRAEGVDDTSLLNAIRWHTLGHPDLDALGRALYAADFLDPGRSFMTEWRAELRDRMPEELSEVTRQVVAARIRRLLDRGVPLLQPTVDFWNELVAESEAGAP
jgi:2-amino-4-hydroxy-6-hydroxymethyldihydropteridine diphosphokinase